MSVVRILSPTLPNTRNGVATIPLASPVVTSIVFVANFPILSVTLLTIRPTGVATAFSNIFSIERDKNPKIFFPNISILFVNGSINLFKLSFISVWNQSLVSLRIELNKSFVGSIMFSLIAPRSPPSRSPFSFSVPNTISLNLSVVVANPNAEPNMTFVATPKGPLTKPAMAPNPILGKAFFTLSGKSFPKTPSSPNNFSLIASLFLANPIEEPKIIPATGPPGTNGKIDVIAPTVAPFAISGKYLFRLLLIFLLNNPPSNSPSTLSPNKNRLTCLESLIRDIAIPAEAPKIGPPMAPVTKDTPPPSNPPVNIPGA